MPNEDRPSQTFLIQVKRGLPGSLLQLSGCCYIVYPQQISQRCLLRLSTLKKPHPESSLVLLMSLPFSSVGKSFHTVGANEMKQPGPSRDVHHAFTKGVSNQGDLPIGKFRVLGELEPQIGRRKLLEN